MLTLGKITVKDHIHIVSHVNLNITSNSRLPMSETFNFGACCVAAGWLWLVVLITFDKHGSQSIHISKGFVSSGVLSPPLLFSCLQFLWHMGHVSLISIHFIIHLNISNSKCVWMDNDCETCMTIEMVTL